MIGKFDRLWTWEWLPIYRFCEKQKKDRNGENNHHYHIIHQKTLSQPTYFIREYEDLQVVADLNGVLY